MSNYFNLKQIITTPTLGDAVLDLVFIIHPEHTSATVMDQISDHCAIHCDFSLVVNTTDLAKKVIFHYKRVNSEALELMLCEFLSAFLNVLITGLLTKIGLFLR